MTTTKAAEDVLVADLQATHDWLEERGMRLQCEAVSRAADAITTLLERVAELEKQRLMVLAAVYGVAPKFVATICDEKLDRSGALLGEVRALARAALTREGG